MNKDFPTGARVKGVRNGKERTGSIMNRTKSISCLGLVAGHIPVKWDINRTRVSSIHPKDLVRI